MHTWRNENQTEGFISCLRNKGSLMASMPTAVVTNILDLVISSLPPPPPPLINGIKHPSMVLNTILMQLVLNLQLKITWINNWQSKTRDLIIYTILCRSFMKERSGDNNDLLPWFLCFFFLLFLPLQLFSLLSFSFIILLNLIQIKAGLML